MAATHAVSLTPLERDLLLSALEFWEKQLTSGIVVTDRMALKYSASFTKRRIEEVRDKLMTPDLTGPRNE